MSHEHDVCAAEELPPGDHRVVEVGGRQIGVFNIGGDFYALPNACFHQNGPVCRGATSGTLLASAETDWKPVWGCEGEILICPWHALEFNVTTGQCLAYPNRRLPTWEVKVDGDQLVVFM